MVFESSWLNFKPKAVKIVTNNDNYNFFLTLTLIVGFTARHLSDRVRLEGAHPYTLTCRSTRTFIIFTRLNWSLA